MGAMRPAAIGFLMALIFSNQSLLALNSFEAGTYVRADSLGNAVTAVNLGSDSARKNPGTLARVENREIQFSAAQEFDSAVFLARIGLIGNWNRFRYSVQVPVKSIQGLSKTASDTNGQGVAVGTYADQQYSVSGTLATDWNGMSCGASMTLLSQTIDSSTGSGIGFDFGVYRVLNPQWAVGAAIRHVAESVSWAGGTHEAVPMAISVGGQYIPNSKLQLLGDVNLDGKKPAVNLGAAYAIGPNVELRAGIDSVLESPQIRLGVGYAFPNISLDYGFSQVNLLGTTHRLGVRYAL